MTARNGQPNATRVLITGMSGAGKSSAIVELARRGFEAVDTDTDEWSEWVDGDWIWREERMRDFLLRPREHPVFVSGCKSNQGRLYELFDKVVLLTAPLPVLLSRVMARATNPYGKRESERDQIAEYVQTVEPLLRRGATLELDTSELLIDEVVDRLIDISAAGSAQIQRPSRFK